MDATLTIVIRAQARQAQAAVAETTKQLNFLQRAAQRLNNRNGTGFFDSLSGNHMIKAGKNLQWLGRQLLYNITLPAALAGGALFKAVMDFEKGMTQLRKVYGDIAEDQSVLRAETDALGESFKLLSTYFGVHVAEVAEIGASWAAAGSAGRGLAENVKATLEAMILGDMEATAATEALIAIQATWRLSTMKNTDGVSELTYALAQLNIVENQTGISFEGLIEVYERAGGQARNAGMEFQELAAMAAAIVPATGGAAQAGNALRTMISRLISPTGQTQEILEKMGITVSDPAWMGAGVTDKIMMMAESFDGLSTAQQNHVSSIIASRWQVNRFNVLMNDLNSETGYYQKALKAASDETQVMATYQRELAEVLQSDPRRWEILKNAIRNTLMDAFTPMIPVILQVMGAFLQLVNAFGKLDPGLQKMIMFGIVATALIGPFLVIIATAMQLIGVIGVSLFKAFSGLTWIVTQVGKLALYPLIEILKHLAMRFGGVQFAAAIAGKGLIRTFVLSVQTLIAVIGKGLFAALSALALALGIPLWAVVGTIAAIAAAIVLVLNDDLRDSVWNVIKDIANAFAQLPGVVASAFNSIIRFLAGAMQQIVDFLSYLNPFARHSPSLVDNVRAGVATILNEYAKLNKIGNLVGGAVTALDSFGAANAGVMMRNRESELREKANVPGVQGGHELVNSILALESELPVLAREIDAQSRKVVGLTAAYDQASAAVDVWTARLDNTQAALDRVTTQIDAAQEKIAQLADTPIQGLTALEDKIFDNEHAQNKLRMELLEFERAGISIDKIRDKYAALNGDIEMLRGEQANLRLAGAGSDILSVYDDQIAALEAQKGEMGEVEQTIRDIESRLDALDLEQRFLELTKAINFDPLERQIDRLANGVTELPFDEIVAQIREQKTIIAEMEPIRDRLTKQVERETAMLDEVTKTQERIGANLDAEEEKLNSLESAYRDIVSLISEMESMLSNISDVNIRVNDQAIKDAAGAATDLFDAGAGQDFEIFGGDTPLGREGDLSDILAFNEEMQQAIDDMLAGMGQGDLFAPLKAKWEGLKVWLAGWWTRILGVIKTWGPLLAVAIGAVFLGVPVWVAAAVAGVIFLIVKYWDEIIAFLGGLVGKLWEGIQSLWDAALAGLTATWNAVIGALGDAWSWVWEHLKGIWDASGAPIFSAVGTALQALWDFFVAVFTGIGDAATKFWDGVLFPIFQALWSFIDGYIVPILELFMVTGLIVFKLVQLAVEAAWGVIKWVFGKLGEGIGWLIDDFQDLLDRVSAIWTAIKDFIVGRWNAIVADVFQPITDWLRVKIPASFRWLKDRIEDIWGNIAGVMKGIWDTVFLPIFGAFKTVFETVVKPAFMWLYDNVIKPIMSGIVSVIGSAWNLVMASIEGGVNFFIKAFNMLASAVNKVAELLGIEQRVSSMGEITIARVGTGISFKDADALVRGPGSSGSFAQGGIVRGAQNAIVGEGSNIHPEYIIPTDPRHRQRALGLYNSLGGALGHGDGFGLGGLGDIVKGAYEAGKKGIKTAGGLVRKGAVEAIWGPAKLGINQAINQIPVPMFKQAGKGILDVVEKWMKGSSTAFDEYAESLVPNVRQGPGSWTAITQMLRNAGIPHKVLSTFRPGARTRNSGSVSWHALNRAIDLSGPTGMHNYSHEDMLKINHAIYDAFKPHLKEMIYGGPGAKNVYRGRDHTFGSFLMREHINHVHAAMARGGFVVPKTQGGSLFRIGEGLHNEKVQVVPLNARNGGDGGRVFNFYGNLEFPNITDGDDAEEFISNLEALAGADS